jgi:cell division protein FtsZ
MTINISVPKTTIEAQLKPRITVVGVGGAGGNAVNNMIQAALEGVDFVVANTDAQALSLSRTDRRIQLGHDTTQGLGTGSRPDIGRTAAEEAVEQIVRELDGSHMAFITAGMGGGTGTGAAPVIARIARECGILTVGVVTKPFHFEGANRMRMADAGIEELAGFVDTLIVIPNQNLFKVANERTTFADAFKMADDVLYCGVRSVTDLMILPGLINLDFADVKTVMKEMGKAMMGSGEASGDRRALDAAEAAIANPLLEESSMKGAKGVLINITGGTDITLFEVDEAANRIRDEVETDAEIKVGTAFDESMDGRIRVSVVATGIESEAGIQPRPIMLKTETKAVARVLPDIRTVAVVPPAAPKAAVVAPVTEAAPVVPASQTVTFATPAPTPAPVVQPTLAFGSTLAPATAASQLQSENEQLAQLAAAIKAEVHVSAPVETVDEPAPAPVGTVEAPVETPVAPVPQAAQAVAVAEAMKAAQPMAPPRTLAAMAERTATPRPQVENLAEGKAPVLPLALPPKVEPKAPTQQQRAAASGGWRPSLFDKYRSLTSKLRTEPVVTKPAAPAQPATVTEMKPASAPVKTVAPAKPAAPTVNVSVTPADRPVTSHSEDELEIPAFLRRQAN